MQVPTGGESPRTLPPRRSGRPGEIPGPTVRVRMGARWRHDRLFGHVRRARRTTHAPCHRYGAAGASGGAPEPLGGGRCRCPRWLHVRGLHCCTGWTPCRDRRVIASRYRITRCDSVLHSRTVLPHRSHRAVHAGDHRRRNLACRHRCRRSRRESCGPWNRATAKRGYHGRRRSMCRARELPTCAIPPPSTHGTSMGCPEDGEHARRSYRSRRRLEPLDHWRSRPSTRPRTARRKRRRASRGRNGARR